MPATFGIVDLFAGPGGLGEGFASLRIGDRSPFQIGISVEKETSAHRTLTLRAFVRAHVRQHGTLPKAYIDFHSSQSEEPDWSKVNATAWDHALRESHCLELGTMPAADTIDRAIAQLRKDFDDTILIGGPPCQAYSLVGRARANGKIGYVPEEDPRHYLFREYIRVLDRLRPAAFVMENVKGMLSSTVESRMVFEMLIEDLTSLGTGHSHHYELRVIHIADGKATLVEPTQPSDFVVRAEDFGVPQRRHRVIIIGIRSDLSGRMSSASIPVSSTRSTLGETIGNLPILRSGISRSVDSVTAWKHEVIEASNILAEVYRHKGDHVLRHAFLDVVGRVKMSAPEERAGAKQPADYGTSNDALMRWIERPELHSLAQHETRTHMASDLGRYLFAAVFGSVRQYSPKAADFPHILTPDHKNWHSGIFNDRFRVQLAHESATTVTSHLSKDGHYFIHPDPSQCRSLTVREAARLQTFPDDYLFLGNRTQQYVQVGNAVPPFLARQIAELIYASLTKVDAQKT